MMRQARGFSHPLVHPHGRGDNRSHPLAWKAEYGSPPRAWGQYGYGNSHGKPHRFTPTGVGTMQDDVAFEFVLPVHPHGRGDNGVDGFVGNNPGGSPPRAWGQFGQYALEHLNYRFTPTGVGTIFPLRASLHIWSVHPHGRGDNCTEPAGAGRITGSPPRAWGQ